MSLEVGARLGPYEILGRLGAGGMGEVYRARDTRLDRTVAVKVLPEHLAADAASRQRFAREARSVSSLNHPHICTLHDVGEQDGVHFLVMEYLEGETLADRLQRGPLPLAEALTVAQQIADALAVAHRQGFIHRDLKPGNVMLAPSGAKLLDFGLAKTTGSGPVDAPMTAAPTATTPLTAVGTIMGTFLYMAPEQLDGHPADARSDIFAFGAMLYEMTSGRHPFEGRTQASLIASILKEEPRAIAANGAEVPPALDRLIRKCLAKDPAGRWQSASDLADELRWIAAGGVDEAETSSAATGGGRLGWIVAAILGLGCVALAALLLRAPAPDRSVLRFQIAAPEGSRYRVMGDVAAPVAVSPDGRTLAFGMRELDGRNRIWVRGLDEFQARPLDGTDGGSRPFWSPDGREIGFSAGMELRRILVEGGPSMKICDAPAFRGADWGEDGNIVFTPNSGGPLYLVPASGGMPTPLTELQEGEGSHRYPQILPGGGALYLALAMGGVVGTGAEAENRVKARPPDGGPPVDLLVGASNARYADGQLLFVRGSVLMARPFDPERLEFLGDARPVANEVQYDAAFERAIFSVSGNVLAFQSGAFRGETRLEWYDTSGNRLGSLGEATAQGGARISPDGRKVALAEMNVESGNSDIWILDIERGVRTRFTFTPYSDSMPVWSPDGKQVLYSSAPEGRYELFVKPAGGSGQGERLLAKEGNLYASDWSPDGRRVLFTTRSEDRGWDVWSLDLQGDGEPVPLLQSPFDELENDISPDGAWLAYASNESGQPEVYVSRFPSMEGKWQVSEGGAEHLAWAPSGRSLYYLTLGGELMVIDVSPGVDQLSIGAPRRLFGVGGVDEGGQRVLSVSPDGERLLVNVIPEEVASAPISVIVNWSAP